MSKIINPDELKVGDVIQFYSTSGFWRENLPLKVGRLYKVYKLDFMSEDNQAYDISKTKLNPLIREIGGELSGFTAWWGEFIWPVKKEVKTYGIVKFINSISK